MNGKTLATVGAGVTLCQQLVLLGVVNLGIVQKRKCFQTKKTLELAILKLGDHRRVGGDHRNGRLLAFPFLHRQ